MVEINFGRKRPDGIIAIDRVDELRALSVDGYVTMGAGVTFTTMLIAAPGRPLVAARRRKRVGVGLGSCGPTILRAPDASAFAEGLFDEAGWRPFIPSDPACAEFGAMVAAAAKPIDDVRGTAA